MLRRAAELFGLALAIGLGLAIFAVAEARSDPVRREARIGMRGWPAGVPPVRVALVSDLHLGSFSTDDVRLRRALDQVAAADPDLVLLAGDYVEGAERGPIPRLAPALARLHPRLGVVAVLGNHDWYADAPAIRRVLARSGVTVLENEAAARGPLAIGGLGDAFTGHDRIRTMLAALRRTPGVRLVLTHSPDPASILPPGLVLAGHTHCGQVVLPFFGPPVTMSAHGRRFACGVIREKGRIVVVGAGIGTSGLPIRFGAPPDWWLLTLGPPGTA